jgi:3D (Asp-Asp-Asp) domain-containing protein
MTDRLFSLHAILGSALLALLVLVVWDGMSRPDQLSSAPVADRGPRPESPMVTWANMGIPPLQLASVEPPKPSANWMTVVALVTAYTPGVESCGDSADGRTSTNRSTDVHPYGIAADGAVLPPGSLIKVPEYMDVSFPDRAWEVDDTGGDMRKNFRDHYIVHLDLRYRTVVSANKVGRQWMEISVNVTGWSDEKRERLRLASHHGWWMREEGQLPK